MKKILLLMMGLLAFTGINAQTKYPVNLIVGSNGNASLDKTEAAVGETVTITTSPNQWYEVDEVTVVAKYEPSGGGGGALAPRRIKIAQGNVPTTKVDNTTYTFTLPESLDGVFNLYTSTTEFDVKVTFKSMPVYEVRTTTATGGNLYITEPTSTEGVAQAHVGEMVKFITMPDRGYELESVKVVVGGTENEITPARLNSSNFTFVLPETLPGTPSEYQDDTYFEISAVFTPRKFPFEFESGHGTVVAEPNYAQAGTTTLFTVEPDAGWKLTDFVIKQVDIFGEENNVENSTFGTPPNSIYTKTQVNENQYSLRLNGSPNVYAVASNFVSYYLVVPYFTEINYPIIINSGAHGTATTDPAGPVTYGETVTINCSPDAGYETGIIAVQPYFDGNGNNANSITYETILPTMVNQDRNTYSFKVEGDAYVDGTVFNVAIIFTEKPVRYDIVIEDVVPTGSGTVTTDVPDLAIGETAVITLQPEQGYQVGTVTVTAEYEVTGGGGGDIPRAPRRAPGIRYHQDDVSVTKIDDTHYSFTAPDGFSDVLSPTYNANTKFYVTATFVKLIDLENRDDNTDVITENINTKVNVRLKDRTLSGNGIWNTICLPFDLTIEGSVLDGAVVKELTSSSYDQSTETLTLEFTEVEEMEAGKPYILRWTTGDGLTEPVFEGVTITSETPADPTVGVVTLKGTYAPVIIEDEDHTKLFFGSNNKLYYPNGAAPTNINSQRFYFQLADGLHAEEPSTSGQETNEGTKFRLFVGGEATAIEIISNDGNGFGIITDEWYDLSGRKISGRPETPGVYINNGRKYVIK